MLPLPLLIIYSIPSPRRVFAIFRTSSYAVRGQGFKSIRRALQTFTSESLDYARCSNTALKERCIVEQRLSNRKIHKTQIKRLRPFVPPRISQPSTNLQAREDLQGRHGRKTRNEVGSTKCELDSHDDPRGVSSAHPLGHGIVRRTQAGLVPEGPRNNARVVLVPFHHGLREKGGHLREGRKEGGGGGCRAGLSSSRTLTSRQRKATSNDRNAIGGTEETVEEG